MVPLTTPIQLNPHQTSVLRAITDADARTFVIFYDPSCRYSTEALRTLRSQKQKYKGYDITKMPGGLSGLLQLFTATSADTGFDPRHRTKPLIFQGSIFIGGYDQLMDRLRNFS